MKKYSKKIALILVLALVLATAIPALAVGKTTTIEGAYEDIELQVIVPDKVTAVLNPYGLPVKVYADDGNTKIDSLTDPGQVATQPLVGVNLSEVDLKVGASVTGTYQGNFRFATSAPSKTAKTNTGLVYLEMKEAPDLAYDYEVSADASTTVCGGFGGHEVMDALNGWKLPAKYNSKATNQLIVSSSKTNTKSGMCKITAGQPNADGEIEGPSATGYFMARLVGNIVQKPTKDWADGDGFGVSITWEFEPAT